MLSQVLTLVRVTRGVNDVKLIMMVINKEHEFVVRILVTMTAMVLIVNIII